MKKFLSLLLALTLLLGCIPAAIAAEEPSWRVNANLGIIKLSNSTRVAGHLTVPAEVDGVAIKGLEYMCFMSNSDVTQLTLPDSIRFFDRGILSTLSSLTEVKLPQQLVVMLAGSIGKMPGLTTLVIPPSVSLIQGSIYDLEGLQSVTFEGVCPVFAPDDYYTTFSGLPETCVIYVPDDQLEAYKAAFADREDVLARIQPSGKNAVVIDWTAPESDFAFDASTGTITGYTGSAARLDIPAAIGGTPVKHIGKKAFQKCYTLSFVNIPEGVETVGDYAFQGNTLMSYVSFPTTLHTLGANAFSSNNLAEVSWSEGLEHVGTKAFYNCDIDFVTLPSTLRTIADNGFERAGFRTLTFGPNVETVGANAFAGCMLTAVTYTGATMPAFGADAFKDNKKEATLTLTDGASKELYEGFVTYMASAFPTCVVTEPANMELPFPTLDVMAGMPFFGTWNAVAAREGDSYYDVALLGMNIVVVLNPDATCQMTMDADVTPGQWYVAEGSAVFAPILEEGGKPLQEEAAPFTLDENGRLLLDVGGVVILLEKEGASYPVPAIPFPALDAEAAAPFTGAWNAVAVYDGSDYYTTELLGIQMNVAFNPDATCRMIMDGETTDGKWFVENGAAQFAPILPGSPDPQQSEGAAFTTDENGRLTIDFGGIILILEKEGATYAAPAIPDIPWPELDLDNGKNFIGTWDAVSFTVDGETHPAELMGPMTIILNDDGTGAMLENGVDSGLDMRWYADYGTAYFGPTVRTAARITFDGNGNIRMEQNGATVLLAPHADVKVIEGFDDLLGEWYDDIGNKLTLTNDGVMTFTYASDGWTYEEKWDAADGAAAVTEGRWAGCPITLESGILTITNGEGIFQIFSRDGDLSAYYGEPEPEMPAAEPIGPEGEAFFGVWTADMGGMAMTMTLNQDGTCTMDMFGEVSPGVWAVENGAANVMGALFVIDGSGSLVCEEQGMSFTRAAEEEEAAGDEMTDEELLALLEMLVQAAENEGSDATSDSGESAPAEEGFTDVKFVLTRAEMMGRTLTPAEIAAVGDYVIFRQDGSVELIISTISVPTLGWKEGQVTIAGETYEGVIVDYYGTNYAFAFAGDELLLDYYGILRVYGRE